VNIIVFTSKINYIHLNRAISEKKLSKEIDPTLIFGPIDGVYKLERQIISMVEDVYTYEWPLLSGFSILFHISLFFLTT